MKLLSLASVLLFAPFWNMADAIPVNHLDLQDSDPTDNYPNSLPSLVFWTGQVERHGPVVHYAGTSLQDVELRIRRAFPDFSWATAPKSFSEDDNSALTSAANSTIDSTTDALSLDNNDFQINCRTGQVTKNSGRLTAIREGVRYLRGVEGMCSNMPGRCGQISCSHDSAINWCNKTPKVYTMPCKKFAQYAELVANKCGFAGLSHGERPATHSTTFGEGVHKEGFSVEVGRSEEHC
ncbi:hypothetical protein B0T17DRAFT_627411 [Bombardia bombarda]|uniref:Uncharacterized protein n=1 Tax=Bombardia bombarda TaxID=252184 RepID=A0AA39XN76_9PEZI|nr:hypothetical protein B0T17DRAFT_627411 [Bombardia bombarda]